jgi:hypothetical protein
MKKRHFPKKFKLPRMNNLQRRSQNWFSYSSGQKKCKSLRDEFDIVIREKHTLLSDDQIDRLWHIIGTQLLQAPNKSIEELIDTLKDISDRTHTGS